MLRYPHTKLFHNLGRIIVLSGPHIQLLNADGQILFSTTKFPPEDKEAVIESGPIRCSDMSQDGRYLATAGDDKQLKIWDLESLTLMSARALPKKPTSIRFSKNLDILVSDKFGDVFRYTVYPKNTQGEEKRANNSFVSHENPFDGELVLGHTSLLTSNLLTQDEKFIITADRDEHIRVSWYPEGYVIESYCLGHKKFVSAIHTPPVSPMNLISGGGDLELKVWDWMTGRLLRDITVFPVVEPFIKVRPQNRSQLLGRCGDAEETDKSSGERRNTGKMKRRNNTNMKIENIEPSEGSTKIPNMTAPVFVVHRICSFVSEGENHIIFSAVGATAIFEFSLDEFSSQIDIRHHDFGKPVIDFTVHEEGTTWVLLDADFPDEPDVAGECPHNLVQAVRWSVDQFVDAGSSVLLDSLNTACSLPATLEDVMALDLYSDLSTLPKTVDGEQGGHVPGRSTSINEPMGDSPTGEVPSTAVGLTKRALGRLKHKRALNQLHQEVVDCHDISSPDAKKVKAESEEGS